MHALDAAKTFLARFPDRTIVGLSGDLGAGKTTFVRAVLSELGCPRTRVTSPSFTLHQTYPEVFVEHFDLYRLQNVDEKALLELGYYDAVAKARYVFVEWPEHATAELGLTLRIRLSVGETGDRSYGFETVASSPSGSADRGHG